MPASSPFAFVSYRRVDSAAASRWLAQSIARTYGSDRVFIDTESIRMADQWPGRIDEALAAATVLLPVIGPDWLSCTDEHQRRRIDIRNDWVRTEIEHALERGVHVLPVVLSDTPMPAADALPASIARLAQHQACALRDAHWRHGLDLLLRRLEALGFERKAPAPVRYPDPMVRLREFSAPELRATLAGLPGWTCVDSERPGAPNTLRTELHKTYTFAGFEDAIAFMAEAAPGITQRRHHPRWENIWRCVSVWLSTWDIGHKPSVLDLDLARHLDAVRAHYPAPQ